MDTARDDGFVSATARQVSILLALVWLGLVLGVSFLATPVKFMAPSLDLTVALDVGRHTFGVFNWVELAFLAALGAALLLARPHWLAGAAWLALAILLLAQTFWMLPVLDARVGVYLAGNVPPPSNLHAIYIVADGIKALLQLGIGLAGLKAIARASREARDDRP